MRRSFVVYASLIITSSVLMTTSGQASDDDVDALRDNAALWYWPAFHTCVEQQEQLQQAAEAILAGEFNGHDAQTVQSCTQWLLEPLQSAASRAHCAFGVEWDDGFNALLPHLSPMHDCAQLVHADAVICIIRGDADAAVERVTILLAMADHIAQEPAVLSLRTAEGILQRAEQAVASIQEHAQLSGDSRAALQTMLERLDDFDIHRAAAVVMDEGRRFREWAEERWSGRGERRMREDFAMMVSVHTGQSPAPGPYEELAEQFEQWTKVHNAVAEAMRQRDRERLLTLREDVVLQQHGWLARSLMSDFVQTYDLMHEAEVKIAELSERVQLK